MQFPLPPRTLLQNRYSIVRQIGQGAMGAVYEAKDERLGHRVALKQRIVNGPEVEQAFKREARILATLRHWALPAVSDYFIEGSHQFLVMQYIPGDDLHTLLQRQRRPFPVTEVLEWADQLLGALEFLHSQSPPIIHRDIKPENIKLSVRG
ncbi:MAG: serine/threonine protein kinase, partial [Ardenticatenaceae bacterium]